MGTKNGYGGTATASKGGNGKATLPTTATLRQLEARAARLFGVLQKARAAERKAWDDWNGAIDELTAARAGTGNTGRG